MAYINLFYRDGNNYKFTFTVEVDDSIISAFKVGEDVDILKDLNITDWKTNNDYRGGYSWDEEADHDIVTIESIDY